MSVRTLHHLSSHLGPRWLSLLPCSPWHWPLHHAGLLLFLKHLLPWHLCLDDLGICRAPLLSFSGCCSVRSPLSPYLILQPPCPDHQHSSSFTVLYSFFLLIILLFTIVKNCLFPHYSLLPQKQIHPRCLGLCQLIAGTQ